jgi:hypothetical protein
MLTLGPSQDPSNYHLPSTCLEVLTPDWIA